MEVAVKHTLESIAALAGVSRGTVSRVINNQPSVKPEVRQKVLAIIAEKGYTPHPQARSLAGGKTGNIGVIVFGAKLDFLTHHIFYEVLQGIQLITATNSYDLLLFSNRSDYDHEYWKKIAISRKIDGLIIMGENIREEYLQFYRDQGIPFVLIGKRIYDGLPLACVTSDYRQGTYDATKYLIGQGKRSIVYIQGLIGTPHEEERYAGYRQALHDAGIAFRLELVAVGKAEQEEARKQMDRLIAEGLAFDAVFAANDLMALGAIESLTMHNYRVPQDIAVIGYDDIQAAAFMNPPLTTVRQHKQKLGQHAVELLLDMLRGELDWHASKDVVIESDLIIRGTA
jgi:LacI family transcriptional regulator